MLNVGWIDPATTYPSTEPSAQLLGKLKLMVIGNAIINVNMNTIRAMLPCGICKQRGIQLSNDQGGKAFLGMGEILIPASSGQYYYAAPSMVVHYIEHHLYMPPMEFWNAIEAFDLATAFDAQDKFDELLMSK